MAARESRGQIVMSPQVASFISRNKNRIDFSLVPVAIILIEFSVFITQLSSNSVISLEKLVLLRFIHTIAMLLISSLVARLYKFFKKPVVSYQALAITGVLVLIAGDIIHEYFASALGIELISVYRRLGIIFIQGSLWFPAIMIVLGYRQEIVEKLQEYGQRLIVQTRAQRRTSNEFRALRQNIEDRIREELKIICNSLKEKIVQVEHSSGTLAERNKEMRSILSGEDLRQFSRVLESFESKVVNRLSDSINVKSINLLAKQFQVLYSSVIAKAPLGVLVYTSVLVALATPAFVYFHSFPELLFSVSIMSIMAFTVAQLITKIQKSHFPQARIVSSVLTFLVGFLPLAADLSWQAIDPSPKNQVPLIITAIALPVTFFLSIEFSQVLRPKALSLIQNDQLKTSRALQEQVTKTVTDEFSQNLSHRWAVFIHGKILTRFAATSLKLEADAKSNSPEKFDATVQNLKSLLSAPDAEFYGTSRDLESEVYSRLKPWYGLLEISIFIEPKLKTLKTSRVRDLGEILEEMISNSIRHGKAKRIDVKLMSSGSNDVEITAVDDSITAPPEKTLLLGLGTRIFNLASDGRWSITRVDSSTEFKLIMEI